MLSAIKAMDTTAITELWAKGCPLPPFGLVLDAVNGMPRVKNEADQFGYWDAPAFRKQWELSKLMAAVYSDYVSWNELCRRVHDSENESDFNVCVAAMFAHHFVEAHPELGVTLKSMLHRKRYTLLKPFRQALKFSRGLPVNDNSNLGAVGVWLYAFGILN